MWSVWKHACLSGEREACISFILLHFLQGDDETGSRDIGRQVDRPEDTDWLSLL